MVINQNQHNNLTNQHSLQLRAEAARETVGLHVQRKGNIVLPDAHKVVAGLVIIPGSAPGIGEKRFPSSQKWFVIYRMSHRV
jgi:hypothetical protein